MTKEDRQMELFPAEPAQAKAAPPRPEFGDDEELNWERFQQFLRSFQEFGKQTQHEELTLEGRKVWLYQNEFWTARQRDAHSLHEISYRACYKPQLPGFFLQTFCGHLKEPVIYDPFMGRGTTLLEARLQLPGCRVIGNDVNPLSGALLSPRLDPPNLEEVRKRLGTLDLPEIPEAEHDPDLLTFYHPGTLAELYGWRAYFKRRQESGEWDSLDAWLRMVACNRLTGHSRGFFSVYTLPPNQATSVKAQRRINERRNQTPEYRDTRALILKKSRGLLRDPIPPEFSSGPEPLLLCHPADQTPKIPDASVDLVVTSPPFLNVVDYLGDNWLRNWFCQVEPVREAFWQMSSQKLWLEKMTGTLKELHRVLRPSGVIAYEVGEVKRGTLELENQILAAGVQAGLAPKAVLINAQNFTKTANCWGVDNNARGTNTNRIVLFQRGEGL